MSDVNEKDEIIHELADDEYNTLVEGLAKYKKLYEEAAEQLKNEKANVADLLMKVDALQDRVNELEKSI